MIRRWISISHHMLCISGTLNNLVEYFVLGGGGFLYVDYRCFGPFQGVDSLGWAMSIVPPSLTR